MTSNANEPAKSPAQGAAKGAAKRPSSTGASPASRTASGSTSGAAAKKSAPSSPSSTTKKAPAKTTEKKTAEKPPAKKTPAGTTPAKGSGSATNGSTPTRTPTAGDYAKTTQDSADSTSVIPAVADKPKDAPKQKVASAPTSEAAAAARRARLQLVRVEPWSVTRLAFVISVAMMIVAVVAVSIFWVVLDLAGVWDQLNGSIATVLSDGEAGFDLTDYLGLGRLVGLTLVLSAINVIVFTMMATIAAHLYNLSAQLMGGIGITFQDR